MQAGLLQKKVLKRSKRKRFSASSQALTILLEHQDSKETIHFHGHQSLQLRLIL